MTALLKCACKNRTFLQLPKIRLCTCLCEPIFTYYSYFLLSQEFASFFFPCFSGKEKKSVWSRHIWLSSLWKAPCLFLPWEQLHFVFSGQTTSKSWSCTGNEKYSWLLLSQISTNWLLRFSQSLSLYTHILKYVRTGTTLMFILCKTESIFSFLKLLCQITFNTFQSNVWLTSLISHSWFSWLQKSRFCA